MMLNSGTSNESEPTDANPIAIGLWGAFFLFAGCLYLWTRYVSESSRAARSGQASADRGLTVQQVRLKQQERLRTESAAAKAAKKAEGDGAAPAPSAVVVEKAQSRSAAPRQRATACGEEDAAAKKALKEKRRKMYLRHKKEREEEEEKRQKMEELGPGWQRHEGGSAMGYSAMDPNAGSGGGGYRAPQRCARRGG